MITKAAKFFVWSVALVLATTAALKLASLVLKPGYVEILDPVFYFLTDRQLMTLAAFVELALAAFLVRSANMNARLLMIGWFGLLCITYHACVALSGANRSCPCLGDVSAWTGIPILIVKAFPLAFAAYLLLGSLPLLALHRQQALREAATAER